MSHAIMVPITAQRTILDTGIKGVIYELCAPPLDFTDAFIYSHGWWTSAQDVMVDYTRFSAELIRNPDALIAVAKANWPRRRARHWRLVRTGRQ